MEKLQFLKCYKEQAYTSNYILPSFKNDKIFFNLYDDVSVDFLANATKPTLEHNSQKNGGSCCLRITESKVILNEISKSATKTFELCDIETFENIAKTIGKQTNRGNAFEKLIIEFFGGVWKANHITYKVSGDVVINEKHYQIKYCKGNFTI